MLGGSILGSDLLLLLFSSLAFGLGVLLTLLGRLATSSLPFGRLPTPNFSQAVGLLAVALVPAAGLKTVATVFTLALQKKLCGKGLEDLQHALLEVLASAKC